MMTVRAVEKGTGRVRTGRIGGGSGSGGVAPAFQADFKALSALPAGVSLSRATGGTYFDASGVLQTAAIDAPRFDHAWNGSAWVATGLLIEEQRTNYARQSIPGTSWGTGGGTYTVNSGVAPDGTSTATQIVCGDGTVTDRAVYLDLTAAGVPAISTGAGWVKGTAGQQVYLILYATDYSNRVKITFDGTWQRIPTAESSSSPQYIIFDTSTTGGADATNGLPAVTFLAWHVDVQGGSFITSTIPTTTAAVTRSADIAQLTGAAQAAMQAVASTVLVEVDQVQGDYAQLMGADGSTVIARDGANTGRLYTEAVSPSLNVLVDTTATFRAGVSKDGSGVSFVSNGGTVSTSSNPGTDFTGRSFRVGSRVDGYFINAHLRSIAIDTTRYSNADLAAKSVVGAAF